MSVNAIIEQALEPLGVPVELHSYDGDAPTYITYFEYNQRSALNGDDEELQTSYSYQVDVWSKGDYTELVNQVKDLLKEAGFTRASEHGNYNEITKIYQKAISFNIVL